MSSHEITHLIHAYGLIVIFLAAGLQAVGFPVPGGTAVVAGAIDAATKHGLPLAGVIVSAALGALIGTTIGFGLGRWRGEPILLRLGRLLRQGPQRVGQVRSWFQERGAVPLFVARFITGARNVAGLVAGASGMALVPFLLVSAAACTTWATVIGLEYYFAGHALLGAPTWLQIVLIVVGVITTIVTFRLLPRGLGGAAKPSADTADATE